MARDEHLDLLSQAGYTVMPLGPRLVRIEHGEHATTARLVPLQKPPTPATIGREIDRARSLGADAPLFLIPRANDTVRRAALKGDLAAVGAADRVVIINGELVDLSDKSPEPDKTMRRRPWGRLAVARLLVRTGGILSSQITTSTAAGITQPAVSKAYTTLRGEGLLPTDGARKLRPSQLTSLIDYAIHSYPGPGGISTYWYSASSPILTADLKAALTETRALISGDLAADEFAPWKQPRTLTIYAPAGIDLASHGLAESNPDAANVILRVPEDATIWRTAQEWTDTEPTHFTDPIITAWELSQSSDVDADQAVDRIKRRLLDESGLS
jgi:hypothetical protein